MRALTIGLAWVLAVCAGCGGNGDSDGPGGAGGGGSGGDAGSLEVLQTFPTDMATDVATDVVLRAEFGMALDESSVTSGSFSVLRDGGMEVQGTVSVSGESVTFTPTESLALLTSHTATLGGTIADVAGATLGEPVTWSFRVRDGQWRDAVLIEINNSGSASNPQVAMDANGNAVAVWQQQDGMRNNIWANRFTPTTGWGIAQLIELDTGSAFTPQVALDANGGAIAAWGQFDGMRNNIWANRFTPTTGWGSPELIELDNLGSAARPQVAVDANGNAVAVWQQNDNFGTNIWANRFTPSAGWGGAQLIELDDVGAAFGPQVALDANGRAVVVWEQFDGMRNNIRANRFTPGGGWGSAELINDAGSATAPQVAADASGNAVAVWAQSDGTRNNIWTNRFTPSMGWGTADLIELDDAGPANSPQVAVDAKGNAVAVWAQSDGTRNNIWTNRFTPSTGWGTAELIDLDDAGPANDPQLAVDANGNAIAVWRQSDGTRRNIWAGRFTPSEGWGIAGLIELDDVGPANSPQLAVDAKGNAVAVWVQSDGTRNNVWANRFD